MLQPGHCLGQTSSQGSGCVNSGNFVPLSLDLGQVSCCPFLSTGLLRDDGEPLASCAPFGGQDLPGEGSCGSDTSWCQHQRKRPEIMESTTGHMNTALLSARRAQRMQKHSLWTSRIQVDSSPQPFQQHQEFGQE